MLEYVVSSVDVAKENRIGKNMASFFLTVKSSLFKGQSNSSNQQRVQENCQILQLDNI